MGMVEQGEAKVPAEVVTPEEEMEEVEAIAVIRLILKNIYTKASC